MTNALLVGIDVGTSSCKAAVLDAAGVELAVARHELQWRHVRSGAELDATDLVDAVRAVVDSVLRGAPDGDVLAVGVASMAEAGYALDAAGRPVAPAMAWHDERAAGELVALEQDLPRLAEVTGARPNARLSAVRHRWRLRHAGYRTAPTTWLNVAEYVVHALGGERVSEPSLASRTGWLDVARGRWWAAALAWSDADVTLLPPLRAAGEPAGRVRGFPPLDGATLTVAGHDHVCAAVGAGALDEAPIVDSCGTAEVLLRAVAAPGTAADRRRAVAAGFTRGRHVLPDEHVLIGGFPSGHVFQRLLDVLGVAEPEDADALARDTTAAVIPSLDQLIEQLTDLEAAADRPAPAEAALLWRMATESVARHSRQVLDQLEALTGPREALLTVGGSARSSLVARARRHHYGEVLRPQVREAAARGAALAAGVAAGLFEDLRSVPRPQPDVVEETA